MTVGNNYTSYSFPLLQQVAEVRNHQVNAQHLLFGKHQTGIDDDDITLKFHHHHVLAYFTQTTEGDYL